MIDLATAEGLPSHAESVKLRVQGEAKKMRLSENPPSQIDDGKGG